jgi:hypothetical protein
VDDQDLLVRAIEQVGAGNILPLLDESDGRERLLRWLIELRDLRQQNQVRYKRDVMNTFRWYGLTEEEAKLVWNDFSMGKQPDYEEGPCRRCGGRGIVEQTERQGCFGAIVVRDRCFTCNGTGVDKKRIKVPEVVS